MVDLSADRNLLFGTLALQAVDDYFTTVSESRLLEVPGLHRLRGNIGVIASGKLEKGERDSNSETFHCNPAG